MSIYENPYFGMKLEFPEGWVFKYWGNRNKIQKNPERVQLAFDDLPSDEKQEKELFWSYRRIKESPAILSCHLLIAAFYRPNGYDFDSELTQYGKELKRELSTVDVLGNTAACLYIESEMDGYTNYIKFIYWQHDSNIWLNCAIEGDSKENLKESCAVFSRIVNI